MSTIIAAVDADTLDTYKNAAMGLSVVSLLVAIVLLKVISGMIGRLVSTVLLVAVALVGYSQRAEITDCIEKVKSATSEVQSSPSPQATEMPACKFFGKEFRVDIPQVSK
jgi:hypothetical protein